MSVILAFFFVFPGSASISDITKGKYFISDVLAGFALTFIVTSYINITTAYLYQQYQWSKYFAARLLYPLIASVVIPAIFVLAFMYILNKANSFL